METPQQTFENFTKVMHKLKGQQIIRELESNPIAFDEVLNWMVNSHVKICNLNLANHCEGVALAHRFHGKACLPCHNKRCNDHQREVTARKRAEKQRKKEAAKKKAMKKAAEIQRVNNDRIQREIEEVFELYEGSSDESTDESSDESSDESDDESCAQLISHYESYGKLCACKGARCLESGCHPNNQKMCTVCKRQHKNYRSRKDRK